MKASVQGVLLFFFGSLMIHGLGFWIVMSLVAYFQFVPRIDVDLQMTLSPPGEAKKANPNEKKKPSLAKNKPSVKFSFSQNTTSADASPEVMPKRNPSQLSEGGEGLGNDITQIPKILREVKAEYPEKARAEGREGKVIFLLQIDEEGRVKNFEVLQSGGFDFDKAASEVIKRFIFSPAMRGNKPVKVEISYAYVFRLR